MADDIIKVRRVLEYEGPRAWVTKTLGGSYIQPDMTLQDRLVDRLRGHPPRLDPPTMMGNVSEVSREEVEVEPFDPKSPDPQDRR